MRLPHLTWIFLLIPCIQSTFRRVLRCLLLAQELKQPCSSGEVLPSYWQCAQAFTLPKGKGLSYSLRALFTWQTIHFGGVSLISWICLDPIYICCHALWRNKIVYLEPMHICCSVWLLWLGWIQAGTRLRNVRCSLSAQHLLGSDASFTQGNQSCFPRGSRDTPPAHWICNHCFILHLCLRRRPQAFSRIFWLFFYAVK